MMIIKNGKFFKDGIQVPIEHGNKEQIEILDRTQTLMNHGQLIRGNDETDEDGDGFVLYTIVCLCGYKVHKRYTIEQNNCFEQEKIKCLDCNLKYVMTACEFSEFFMVLNLV